MQQESATQESSQNKVARESENQPDEEVKTVNIEMQSREEDNDK